MSAASIATALNCLSADDRARIEKTVKNCVREIVSEDVCCLCLETPTVPVRYNHGVVKDCGCNPVVCLKCMRTMYKLNSPKGERGYVKHILCPRVVNMTRSSAKDLYRIDVDLMSTLDAVMPGPVACEYCEQEFETRRALYAHTSPSNFVLKRADYRGMPPCPKISLECGKACLCSGACSFRGNSAELLVHVYEHTFEKHRPNNWIRVASILRRSPDRGTAEVKVLLGCAEKSDGLLRVIQSSQYGETVPEFDVPDALLDAAWPWSMLREQLVQTTSVRVPCPKADDGCRFVGTAADVVAHIKGVGRYMGARCSKC